MPEGPLICAGNETTCFINKQEDSHMKRTKQTLFVLCLIAAVVVCVQFTFVQPLSATPGCETCQSATRCGGYVDDMPGWANIAACTGQKVGVTCSYCAGTANKRNCKGSALKNNKKCTYPTTAPTCGDKYPNSKCASITLPGGLGKTKYCKKAGTKSGTCSLASSCNGEAAHP